MRKIFWSLFIEEAIKKVSTKILLGYTMIYLSKEMFLANVYNRKRITLSRVSNSLFLDLTYRYRHFRLEPFVRYFRKIHYTSDLITQMKLQ